MTASHLLSLLALLATVTSTQTANTTFSKRGSVLTDLSGGFCRSYQFGVNIANDVLYMVDLDGGLVPDDGNSSHNYMLQLDLSQSFSMNDGANYKMSLVDAQIPVLKDQALWSSRDNSSLFLYGGRRASNISLDEKVWKYEVQGGKWEVQETSAVPVRYDGGVNVNVPELQSAYWLGGYQDSSTTTAITDSRRMYATSMVEFNTTTGEIAEIESPVTPVQDGALVYIPVGEKGLLVFLGGETPSMVNGTNATMAVNSWNYVQVYDIASGSWYNQSTSGSVASRTQFCATVQHDLSSASYQIYVLGGADYHSQDVITDVDYLSIPSFKWYNAAGLSEGRMTLSCQAYGRQIFGVGGRLAWADDSDAGCYTMPAFIYDAQSEVVRSGFDPGLMTYSLSSATAADIKASPYPSSWASPALKELFVSQTNTTSATASPSPTSSSGVGSHSHAGAIAGGVVGGVVGLALLLALGYLFLRRRRRAVSQTEESLPVAAGSWEKAELPTSGCTVSEVSGEAAASELESEQLMTRHELAGSNERVYELDAQGAGQR
ncbi:uncharacterized protein BO72DRAFT_27003 [Aspergillus fijiensis CBS 313.89]|uniref:Kelch repeat protein n=1 Tax=Aspergillus fijiensis CBS 313.89 TaxID=1448319 RepID=A0A8G1RW82_9EURO|nr:uncharacterized protein BO72DRAFT_27003 [Aspergillus fijiensis CBS 313.89]RAK80039.1 hypothetical protein BO72DRAFT_27003 [Aspergillus fijiensis CBS 313.89]